MNNIFQPDEHNLERAALAVKSGGLVAMPTETVYGLGANVYIAAAVAKIFEAKQRPFFDPLISHIAETPLCFPLCHLNSCFHYLSASS